MSDIVERLEVEGSDAFRKHYSLGMWELCAEAAREIKSLRLAAKEALEFMEKIEGHGYGGMANFEVARQSLRSVVGQDTLRR
jgi:hypothetical protein